MADGDGVRATARSVTATRARAHARSAGGVEDLARGGVDDVSAVPARPAAATVIRLIPLTITSPEAAGAGSGYRRCGAR